MHFDKEKNTLTYISKPYLNEKYFKNWKDKAKHKHIDLKKEGIIEEDIPPYFLYESITLEKRDDKTVFTLIEVFPSFSSEPKDKFNIIRKHVGRKKRLKINLDNSKINKFDEVDQNDPLGKLLLKTVKE
jgi:hypothetical protein